MHADKKRRLDCQEATTSDATSVPLPTLALEQSSVQGGFKKSLPRISGFALIEDDKVLAFIPRIKGEDGIDACVTTLWSKQRKHGGTICAVYSPQLLTREGKMELRTFEGKPWHYSPVFLLNKRNKLASKAEAEMVEGRYLPKFMCMNCHDDRANGKGYEPPPHKFWGDFSKGGCKYPPNLFDQGHSDFLDEILEERDTPPQVTGESPDTKPEGQDEDEEEELEEIDAE